MVTEAVVHQANNASFISDSRCLTSTRTQELCLSTRGVEDDGCHSLLDYESISNRVGSWNVWPALSQCSVLEQ
jgi:hypothetical protein